MDLVGRCYNAITVVRCPHCGASARHAMGRFERPAEYSCVSCNQLAASPSDRCCVYCAYGSVPCAQGQSDARLLRLIGMARVRC